MNKQLTIYICFALLFCQTILYSQAQLVQSFIESNNSGDTDLGIFVSSAGDVNNDRFADVIVGAWSYNDYTGRAYIYFGANVMDNISDLTITGEGKNNRFGYRVSSTGDVNNDGYDDVIVSAYGYNENTGRAYIYYGGSMIDNIVDITLTGEISDNYFGISVSDAGDVNNDGYNDVIVGAQNYNSSTGRAYIYMGGSLMDNKVDITITGEEINNEFGGSVSFAGDVNNDGYDDVIVGAYGYKDNTGRGYVYYGGGAMDNIADLILTGEGLNNDFGISVSNAGDVNNDGYDDIIVGARDYKDRTGRAYIYYGGSTIDTTSDVIMTGETINNSFGRSVSYAGDLNNDGYGDIIVGAYRYSNYTGRAYVYYGANAMDNTSDIVITGEGVNNYFGYSVSNAGNVNNDEFDDVVVGAYSYNNHTGRVYIYYGANVMDKESDVVITGEGTDNLFGTSVSYAGDINNDGYDDVIVGTHHYDNYKGRAYIYYGGSEMDNIVDVTLEGEATNHYFGYSVSNAGDVNNDGYDDIIVGAHHYNNDVGQAYIYYGGSPMNIVPDITMIGKTNNDEFGISVSNAGDVNNDGYDDVIVGAKGYNDFTGRAYIYYGASMMDNTPDVILSGEENDHTTFGPNYEFGISVCYAGDINNDGYDDVIVGAWRYHEYTGRAYIYYGANVMDNTSDVTITGERRDNSFGYSVSNGGDINNDGYDDVIVGACRYNDYKGRAYIYYGGSLDYNTADIIMTGETSWDSFGCSVSYAGDVNNDGYDDVIVGAKSYGDYTGRAYIYYGENVMDNVSDITITGEGENNSFGRSVSYAGNINNDGFDDVIIGARNYPVNGKVYIYSDPNAPLPVELITFSAKTIKSSVKLIWQTATEVNNYGYEIERKQEYVEVERDDWNKIGFIEGNGNSNSTKEYSFVDDELLNGKILYRLKQIDIDGSFEYSDLVEVDLGIPTKFELHQNYPNPFNPNTTISYELPKSSKVTLTIYNILGKKIKILFNNQQNEGRYKVKFDDSNLSSGVYYYQLKAGNFAETKKMILMR